MRVQPDEAKLAERRFARYCRQISYKIRKIRENDPSVTSIEIVIEDVLPSLMKAMAQNVRVNQLEISCTSLSVGGLVGRMLLANSTLQVLKIRACHIPCFSAATIFQSLKGNSTLEELDLSLSWGIFDSLSSSRVCRDATTALSDAILDSTGLKILNLRKTGIRRDQVQKLFQALSRNRTLDTLDVSENREIGKALVASLIQHLPRMKLQNINAELTGISESLDQQASSMEELSKALQLNTSLWKLTGIVLHRVEHYSSEDQRNTQRECIRRMEEMELFKTRNGLIEGKWLIMESTTIWSDLLPCVAQSENRFRNDLVFFLMQQKCEWMGPSLQSSLRLDNKTKSTRYHGVEKRRQPSRALALSGLPASKKRKYSSRSMMPEKVPLKLSRYHCRVHLSHSILPLSCCSFERKIGSK